MVTPVYEVACDSCGTMEYISGVNNKKELATELEARGYIVKGNCKQVFCDEQCERNGAN